MAGSVNKVILVGNLGNDPDARTMQNGGKVVNLSVATSESWKDKNTGDRQERTQWHKVVIFNENLAGVAERYLKKGSKVYIEGQLETRKWQNKDGVDQYTTEVVLRPYRGELTLLDRAGGEGGGRSFNDNGGNYGQSYDPGPAGSMPGSPSGSSAQGGQRAPAARIDELEDEIPF